MHAQEVVSEQPALENLSLVALRERRRSSQVSQSDIEFAEGTEKRPPSPNEHPDEHQIKLDTDRSFVLYPVGEISCY